MDVENLLAKASDSLSVRRAFGTAYEKDGLLIIPVAMVIGGGGGGEGTAPPRGQNRRVRQPSEPDTNGNGVENGLGEGSGGGFGGVVLPVGIYVANGEGVRWVPA